MAILNHDNPLLLQTAQTVWTGNTLTDGFTGGDVQGQLINPEILVVQGVALPLPGQHNARNYLAALTVAQVLGLKPT